MYSRRLKPLALLLPVVFIGAVILIFASAQTSIEVRQVWPVFVALTAGAAVFTLWIFRLLERGETDIQDRSEQLAALHSASLALTQELDLEVVLQQVVDQARKLAGAQYGALGVLDEKGDRIEQFIVSGISPEQRARMGPLPSGKGLLGVLIHSGESVRVTEIAADPRSVGFPRNHPDMSSLLGVPIRFKGEVLGDLYMTNKQSPTGQPETFSQQDQQILEMFASQAAIVITNAQLYRQAQQLALFQERERIGMDLHDGIIPSIYAVGLTLEDVQYQVAGEAEGVKTGLVQAIAGLNDVIRDIRNYILDLRPQRFQGRDLAEGLAELARELRAHSFITVDISIASDTWQQLAPAETVGLLHIAREALTNIRKHARANQVKIDLEDRDDTLVLTIVDNGSGFDLGLAGDGSGNGLRNMTERAHSLGGTIDFSPQIGSGTRVEISLPV
jgi:signal transduction histidine kinase